MRNQGLRFFFVFILLCLGASPIHFASAYTIATKQNAVVTVTPLPLPKNEVVLPNQYIKRGYTVASYELTTKQLVTLNKLNVEMLVPKMSLKNKKDIGLEEYIQDIHFVVNGDYFTLSAPGHSYGKQSLSLKSRPGEVFRRNGFGIYLTNGVDQTQNIQLVPGESTRIDIVVIFKDITPKLDLQSNKTKTTGGQKYKESIIETRLSYYAMGGATYTPYYNDLSIGVEAFVKFDGRDGSFTEGDGINDPVTVYGPDHKFQQKIYVPTSR